MIRPTILSHIVARDAWQERPDPSGYAPPSLTEEGFIHFSTLWQVDATASRFYAERSDLLLLVIDAERLKFPVRWEDLYGHGEFPHLYGPLNKDAVLEVVPFPCHTDGSFTVPDSVKVAYAS